MKLKSSMESLSEGVSVHLLAITDCHSSKCHPAGVLLGERFTLSFMEPGLTESPLIIIRLLRTSKTSQRL